MKIDLSPKIGDTFPGVIWEAHEMGSVIKSTNSMPCSICRQVYESGVEEVTRTHFHGSDFGACARKVFNVMKYGKSSGISNANFLMDGHLHEASMLQNIIAGLPDGWKVKSFGNEQERIGNLGNGMEIVVHPDGLITDDNRIALLECKSVKEYTFRKIREKEEISSEWYGQMQAYMIAYGCDLTYLIVKHRETSKILMPIRIEKDLDFIVTRLNKLKDIKDRLMSGQPEPDREHLKASDDECRWCTYKEECWRD